MLSIAVTAARRWTVKNVTELKHCPFCGGKPLVAYDKGNKYRGIRPIAFVLCARCNARTSSFVELSDAINAWNRRANDEVQ